MNTAVPIPLEAQAIATALLQESRRLDEQLEPLERVDDVDPDAALDVRLDIMSASSDARSVAEDITAGHVVLTETPLYDRGLVVDNSLVVDALNQLGQSPEGAAFDAQLLREVTHRLATGEVSLVDPEQLRLMPLEHEDPTDTVTIESSTDVDRKHAQPEAREELNAAQAAYNVSRAMFPNLADQSRPARSLPAAHAPDGQGPRSGIELGR